MSVIILKNVDCEKVYDEAAAVFGSLYEQITGEKAVITDMDDGESDLVVIGSDAVNDFLMNEMFARRVSSLGIRYGTDDYCIRTYRNGERKILILAGGRGRSTLYAIYDYFERYAGCHYFWDGDVIPCRNELCMEGIDITEAPRFEYRGLRYFAHRGLKRFQAEFWSFADWKREIDWMVKKRLNFFMLRIGMDDVWQRAFPKEVPYPEGYYNVEEEYAVGFDDRSDFWTLEYRGKLREQILEYARDMDLMYPVDCGTMTHWYSATPKSFLNAKKPVFLPQASRDYSWDIGRVFDFRIKENMDIYMQLTDTMVEEYDKRTDLFHTIGLGERRCFTDKEDNFSMKLFAYRRLAENLRRKYPNAKLMLASWDFYVSWTPEEVQNLLKELDPERTIILDYTSDGHREDRTYFTDWKLAGKFPWIFGLFHAYEAASELRGAYDIADERLEIAAQDPLCKGMILWPELSHSDPLVLEYLSANAWLPLEKTVEELLERFCRSRYGACAEQMNHCWQKLLPFLKLQDWSLSHDDEWCRVTRFLTKNYTQEGVPKSNHDISFMLPLFDQIIEVLKELAVLAEGMESAFIKRDVVDMVRTILGRFLNYLIVQALMAVGDEERVSLLESHYLCVMDVMEEVLSLHTDFSVYESLEEVKKTAPVNPNFEATLKRNIYNWYCAQPASELMSAFRKEALVAFAWLKTAEKGEAPDFSEQMEEITKEFMETPLKQLRRTTERLPGEVFSEAAERIGALRELWKDKL